MVHTTCGSDCAQNTDDGFVTDEMWLVQANASACNLSGYGSQCWVEAGYSTYPDGPSSTDYYYWADYRPPNQGYREFDLHAVPSADLDGYTNLQIYTAGGNSWYVNLYTPTLSYPEVSYDNSMAPNDIQIGQELSGQGNTNGAHAPYAYFWKNEWVDTTQNHWHWQTSASGSGISEGYPPYAEWLVWPQNSSTGGDFEACTC